MNWDNQLPGSSCGSYHPLYELFRAKKVEHFLHTFTLVAWPFQMQYSSKSWHILQDMTYFGIFFLVVFFDHKSLLVAIQV